MNKNIVPIEARPGDGRRAHLPHPLFQSAVFLCTRSREPDEYRKRSMVRAFKNIFGDVVTIRSSRTLLACPDMGVFLATVALIQKHGFSELIDSATGETTHRVRSVFPISELYDLTGMGRSSARERLLTSLEVLGSVTLSVRYAQTEKNLVRHRNFRSFEMSSWWDVIIVPRRGRAGSLVELYPSHYLIPTEKNLWADAELCNKIKNDTARSIFWNLIARQHYKGGVEQWRNLLGSQSQSLRKWEVNCLCPALDELAVHGYIVSNEGKIYTVKRP